MKKIVSKRIKVTKNGKVLRRAMGLGHYRAKKSGEAIKRKKSLRAAADIVSSAKGKRYI